MRELFPIMQFLRFPKQIAAVPLADTCADIPELAMPVSEQFEMLQCRRILVFDS